MVLLSFSILLFVAERLYCSQGKERFLDVRRPTSSAAVLFCPALPTRAVFFLHVIFLFLIAHNPAASTKYVLAAAFLWKKISSTVKEESNRYIDFLNFTYLSSFFIIRLVFSLTLRSILHKTKE